MYILCFVIFSVMQFMILVATVHVCLNQRARGLNMGSDAYAKKITTANYAMVNIRLPVIHNVLLCYNVTLCGGWLL